MPDKPAIPSSADDITAPWLTDVLRYAGAIDEAQVTETAVEQVGAGVGIMGELFKVALAYDAAERGAPASVVVKLPSPYESNRAQGVSLGMYEAEIRFYNELAGRTLTRTPKAYFADIVSGTADFVMVMEDLGDLTMADQIEGMTAPQAERATLALADLHAGWWGKVQTPELEWVPSVVHERIHALAGMWPDLWQGFQAKFADRLPEGAIAVGDRIAASYWSLMTTLGSRPWTLLHQDYRVENLFFGDDDVVVIDWQGLGRGPGAYDLAYELGGSMTTDDRRVHEERIVRSYYDRLVAGGVTGYSFDELWRDYRLSHLVNTSTPVLVGATMDLANERGVELIATLGNRHFAAAVDLDAVALIPS